ncbi:MAG: hypothetical protein AAF502_16835 [Bacteroidota bacterium]
MADIKKFTPLIKKAIDNPAILNSLTKGTGEKVESKGSFNSIISGFDLDCKDGLDLPDCAKCSADRYGANDYYKVTFEMKYDDGRYGKVAAKAFEKNLGDIALANGYELKPNRTGIFRKLLREVPIQTTVNGETITEWEPYWDYLEIESSGDAGSSSSKVWIYIKKNVRQAGLKYTPRGISDKSEKSDDFSAKALTANQFKSEWAYTKSLIDKLLSTDVTFSAHRGKVVKKNDSEELYETPCSTADYGKIEGCLFL